MITPTEKKCSRCKTVKRLEDFPPDNRMKLKKQSWCYDCHSGWRKENKEYIRRKNKEWKDKNPHYALNWARKRNYGISPFDVERLFQNQGGMCNGCLRNLFEVRKWVVDHDHQSGKVRGLLCDDCNIILGRARDEVTTLLRLASYLQPKEAEEYV